MANPYHDAEGKFCSKGEMKAAYEQLAENGDHEGYFKLRTEYEATAKANSSFEKTVQVGKATAQKTQPALEPIDLPHSELSEPWNNNLHYTFDWTYDDYSAPEGSHDDGYGRNRRYTNLRITSEPDVRAVLARIFDVDEAKVPDDLIEHATNTLEMDSPDSYEIGASMGYYGEETYIHCNQLPALRKWYWERNNAYDNSGVLDYVRGKGVDTTGKSPVEAIKAQLAVENNGKVVSAVTEARAVSVKKLSASQIVILDKARLENATPAPVKSPIAKPSQRVNYGETSSIGKDIAGVVFHKDGKYLLVDGYARHKSVGSMRKQQEYIVLDTTRSYWMR